MHLRGKIKQRDWEWWQRKDQVRFPMFIPFGLILKKYRNENQNLWNISFSGMEFDDLNFLPIESIENVNIKILNLSRSS